MPKVLGEFRGDARIKRLQEPKVGRVLYKDAGCPGLYLQVSAGGKRVWLTQFKGHGQKVIGTYHPGTNETKKTLSLKLAREVMEAARKRAKAGLEPFPDTSDRCFPAVWERFEQGPLSKLKHRSKETFSTLRRRIGEEWDDLRIEQITAGQCEDLLKLIEDLARTDRRAKKGGKGATNNAYAALKRFFDWCWRRHLIDESPMARLRPPHPTAVRERKLEPDELVAIWNAAGEEMYPYKELVRFAMLVPARIWSEVARIHRKDVAGGVWKYRIAKTGAVQELPLPDTAISILAECPEWAAYYFSEQVSQQGIKRRIDKRTEIEDWVFHDFRTAFVTHLRELGVPFDLADQIQRPPNKRTAGGKHYDMSVRPGEKGEVLAYWSYVVRCWIDGKQPKRWRDYLSGAQVVDLKRLA